MEQIAKGLVAILQLEEPITAESLKKSLEKLIEDLDGKGLMEGAESLLKGYNIVNIAKSVDETLYGFCIFYCFPLKFRDFTIFAISKIRISRGFNFANFSKLQN